VYYNTHHYNDETRIDHTWISISRRACFGEENGEQKRESVRSVTIHKRQIEVPLGIIFYLN